MKGRVLASGILRGLAALYEHKWFAVPSELVVCVLSHLLAQRQFPEFIGEGFSLFYDTNCSLLVQAEAAPPKLAQTVALMRSNQSSHCARTLALKQQSNQWEEQMNKV